MLALTLVIYRFRICCSQVVGERIGEPVAVLLNVLERWIVNEARCQWCGASGVAVTDVVPFALIQLVLCHIPCLQLQVPENI